MDATMGSTESSEPDPFSVTTVYYDTYSHRWTATNFEEILTKQEYTDSPEFLAEKEFGHKWFIRLGVENNNAITNGETFSLHLFLQEVGKTHKENTSVLAKFEFHLLNEKMESIKKIGTMNTRHIDMNALKSVGIDNAFDKSFLRENHISKDLHIQCDMMIQKSESYRNANEIDSESRKKLCQDFKSLLHTTESYSDVELITKSKKNLKAHKIILSARSPVFCEIFKKDNSTAKIDINFDDSAVSQMLNYIYCAEIDANQATPELLSLADDYQIKDLIEICRDKIIVNLTVENAIHTYVHVQKYPDLKAATLEFIKKHKTLVKNTESFQKLGMEHPNLLVEIVKEII